MSAFAGLADFVRAIVHVAPADDGARAEIARLVGLDDSVYLPGKEKPGDGRRRSDDAERASGRDGGRGDADAPRDPAPAREAPPAGNEVPSTLRALDALPPLLPEWVRDAASFSDREEDAAPRTRAPESLLAPALARAVLGGALATTTHDGPLWVERAVRWISSGKTFDEVPRRPRPTLLRGAQVLVDRSGAMLPFHEDVKLLLSQIRSIMGESLVDVLQFESSPMRGAGAGAQWNWTDYRLQLPEPGTVVMAVTDLGIGEVPGVSPASPPEWEAFAAGLRRHGCPLRVLVPYPEKRWPPRLRELLTILAWDRRTGVRSVRRALGAELPSPEAPEP